MTLTVDRPVAADMPAYDVARVRRDFPILATRMNDRPLVYLDTAASAQKPRAVIDALTRFYERDYANIHRGIYDLSQRATAMDDEARRKVQRFLGAADWREIVFTRNATEAINLVAASFLRPRLRPGDEILVTEMEHHANIVPWQMAAEATGAHVVAAPVTDAGELDLDAFKQRIGPRTRMIAVALRVAVVTPPVPRTIVKPTSYLSPSARRMAASASARESFGAGGASGAGESASSSESALSGTAMLRAARLRSAIAPSSSTKSTKSSTARSSAIWAAATARASARASKSSMLVSGSAALTALATSGHRSWSVPMRE